MPTRAVQSSRSCTGIWCWDRTRACGRRSMSPPGSCPRWPRCRCISARRPLSPPTGRSTPTPRWPASGGCWPPGRDRRCAGRAALPAGAPGGHARRLTHGGRRPGPDPQRSGPGLVPPQLPRAGCVRAHPSGRDPGRLAPDARRLEAGPDRPAGVRRRLDGSNRRRSRPAAGSAGPGAGRRGGQRRKPNLGLRSRGRGGDRSGSRGPDAGDRRAGSGPGCGPDRASARADPPRAAVQAPASGAGSVPSSTTARSAR